MRIKQKHRLEALEYHSEEEFLAAVNMGSDVPERAWLFETFKSKSAMIRYLHLEKKLDVKGIVSATGLAYRHVYSVVAKTKASAIPTHVCPVCMNRKG